MAKKTSSLGVRVQPHIKSALDKAADADNRSTSSLVEKILGDWLRAKGFLARVAAEPGEHPTKK